MPLLRRAALMIPQIRRLYDDYNALLQEHNRLASILANGAGSPFFHYNASFDPQEVMRRHAARNLQPVAAYLTNFLGVRIDPKCLPAILNGRAGQVEGLPIPVNWHADIAEWGAVLRAVDLARRTFTVIELGCGWGCWMNNSGVAARRAGLQVNLVGVEGDAGHLAFAVETCAANGFRPAQVTLHHGIAAPTAGVALFPRQAEAGTKWGLEPIFGATAQQRAQALAAGTHDELPMIALAQLAAPYARVDLLHVDIQGGEADLIANCRGVLRQKVHYLVVGTHSRPIEGRVIDTLLADGWTLEIERPAIMTLAGERPVVTVDGVQGWRNPHLSVR